MGNESTTGRDFSGLTDSLGKASKILKSMGNQRRLEILACLSEQEMSVGQLERTIKISQSALSQHLGRLRRDDIVTTRRDAQTIFYSLYDDKIRQLLRSIELAA
ncbi:metalloregulator ArsR/SmtB family transcription factor [Sneathiella sp. P13V-1]|uniref:ArsR/SmtB family transcription factor n=1 Tax=Sneathiella sp. P13V-1 TaxID=2697366 RepID=UPI00187B246F|nr:metalloregulator ArsR/SmtB family transcription factor [Sneathiella sp. P13V-1]MBE7635388.1 metalloregulator ArsR/SmtB family transcription factor [Sneathiella sp. P13V-1]